MPTPQYSQEEMWKIYEKLPEELKQAVFSAENADHTFSICERYGINECSQIASLIGLVLMGVLLPRNFEAALVKDLGIESDVAQRVTQEVNRFIFYPVKQQLEQLHVKPGETGALQEVGVTTPRHSDRDGYMVEPEPSPDETAAGEEKKSAFAQEQKGSDTYRESVE